MHICSRSPGQLDIWVFPKIGVPQNGWFIREHPIKMDDLGVPLFFETPIFCSGFLSYPGDTWRYMGSYDL